MSRVTSFPYAEVQFTKAGQIFVPDEERLLVKLIEDQKLTDLIVISHGWNNDLPYARGLYKAILDDQVRPLLDARSGDFAGRRFGVLGIFWPSIRFAEEDAIAGGGASLTDAAGDAALQAKIDDLRAVLTDAEDQTLLDGLQSKLADLAKPAAQTDFVELNRKLIQRHPSSEQQEDGSHDVLPQGRELLNKLSGRTLRPAADEGGAAAVGGGGGGGSLFSRIKRGASNLLNYTTYYRMKERAGVVGVEGVAPLLQRLTSRFDQLRLHLVGHSFGGRLVTAVASQMPNNGQRVRTLLLLQAAFSHNGFAQKFDGARDGFFRQVVSGKKINGPILITHTRKDKAVGLAYAIASRAAGTNAEAVGDKNDPYGGIGSNGAQKTPEADNSLPLHDTREYDFAPHKLYNLLADDFIDGHSAITNKAVANVLLWGVSPK